MESREILSVIGLLTVMLVGVYGQSNEVVFTASPRVAVEGDTIVLTCTLSNFVTGESIEISKYASDDSNNKVTLNTGFYNLVDTYSALEDDFKFEPSRNDEGQTEFTLTITNARVEYSGFYICDYQDVESVVQVDIIRAPSEVEMHIDGEVLSEPLSIELDGSLDVRVNCKASGSNPQPQVHLVAENEAGEQLDLTHYLAEQESELTLSEGEFDGFEQRTGMIHLEGVVTLSSSVLGGHEAIFCTAKTEGLNDDPLTTPTYTVEFQGSPPNIVCDETLINTEPYAKDVTFKCSVHADPHDITWTLQFPRYGIVSIEADPSKANLTRELYGVSEFSRNMRVDHMLDPDDQFRSYIIVKFARAVPQMFKTYSLTVHNSKGTGHAELVLETDADLAKLTSVATAPLVSLAILLFSVFSRLLL